MFPLHPVNIRSVIGSVTLLPFLFYIEKVMSRLDFIVSPGGALTGQFRVPGDKSISHRSIMFGSLADGVSHVSGFLQGEDSLNTLRAFRAMGVNIEGPSDEGRVIIHGVFPLFQ